MSDSGSGDVCSGERSNCTGVVPGVGHSVIHSYTHTSYPHSMQVQGTPGPVAAVEREVRHSKFSNRPMMSCVTKYSGGMPVVIISTNTG